MIIHKSFGLDLGTTNSTAAIVQNGEVIFAEEGKAKIKTIPSMVAIRRNGQEVVGTIAKNEFYSGNPDSKKSIKRDMGKDIKICLSGTNYSPEQISAKIIEYCRQCLLDTIGNQSGVVYDRVVITVPAYFSLAQKDATRKAGELAGLNVQMLLEEPTAAAINYAIRNDIENGIFMVFDLGGGTFDISILEKTGSIPVVLATAGNNFLGGDNFDYILARHFLEILVDAGEDVSDIDVDASDRRFRLLMFAAENVKKQLTVSDAYDIYFPDIFKDNSGVDLTIDGFSRDDFNGLIKEKIETDIITECERALEILKSTHNMGIEEITHILLVGGSTKIPYVQDVIKKHYCITERLSDVTMYEPDLSVSAGAALVANANGTILEESSAGIKVEMNSPYVVDANVYISGKVLSGDITSIEIDTGDTSVQARIGNDATFVMSISADKYTEKCSYHFYNGNQCVDSVTNDDTSTIDIIAPMPVQNEDIAIEIIDVERGKIDKDVIISKGSALPAEAINTYKTNEYSSAEIRLPIWEGPRHIYDLIISLPDGTAIGSRIEVKTIVNTVSDVQLSVKLEGREIKGQYIKIEQSEIDTDTVDDLDTIFESRISNVDTKEERERLMEQKENLSRELDEAASNNDGGHFANVSEKYKKLVATMPASKKLEDSDFDEIGEYIKSKLTPDLNISEYDVDNMCFHGKRFLRKGNNEGAQKCMEELEGMKRSVEMISEPKQVYIMAKFAALQCIKTCQDYVESRRASSSVVASINREIQLMGDELTELLEKYDMDDPETPEMLEAGRELINLTRGLFRILESIEPEGNEALNIYKGLVSKA